IRSPLLSDQAAFQEVDDAVRQDDLKAWWKRWGNYVVGATVLLVVAVVALVGWRQYDASRRAQASTAYSIALSKIGQDNAAARAELDKLAESAPEPYRWLAALASAQLRATPEEQVAALQAVAPQLPPELSDLAIVIAGFRSVGTPKEGEVAAGRADCRNAGPPRDRARQGRRQRPGCATGAGGQRFLAAVGRLRQLCHAASGGRRHAAGHLDRRRGCRHGVIAHLDHA